MATAIQTYRVDWNKPPPHPLPGITDLQGTPFDYIEHWDGFHGTGHGSCLPSCQRCELCYTFV